MEPVSSEREHDAKHKAPVSDPVRDECFLGCVTRFLPIDVVTDEQVGAETYAFPTDKHQQEVIGQYQSEHCKHEEVQECKEPIEAFVAVHVTDGEHVNQKTDESNEQCVGAAETVHRQAEVGAKLPNLNPGPQVIEDWLSGSKRAARFKREIKGDDCRNTNSRTRYKANELFVAQPPANKPIDGGTGERRKDN